MPISISAQLDYNTSLRLAGLAIFVYIVYRTGLIVHRVFFHPLSKFPGPKLLAASYLPQLFQDKVMGTFGRDVKKLHDEYGPIVRTSPTSISINNEYVWQDVFGRQMKRPEFSKPKNFFSGNHYSILVSDVEDHRRQRRLLAHGFSESALYEQEPTINASINQFMKRLKDCADTGQPVEIVRLLNYAAFDIVGDLTFGESFKTLESSEYHFWIDMLCESFKGFTRLYFLSYYPALRPLLLLAVGKVDFQKRAEVKRLVYEKTEKRMKTERADGHKDILTNVLNYNESGKGMSREELLDTADVLIAAGSDTIATGTAGLLYHLTRNLRANKRVTDEIRTAFISETDITIQRSSRLQYLAACINEALRVYPPSAEIPPRISPGGYVDGQFIPKGTYVYAYPLAINLSSQNFLDPNNFIPERWLPQAHQFYESQYESDKNNISQPFSYGPRDCIGRNLAKAEMRLFICRILWSFNLEAVPGTEDWDNQRVFQIPDKKPLPITFIPRF